MLRERNDLPLNACRERVDEFDEGRDPCVHVLRLYADEVHRKRVERNHPPSVWRRTNMG